MTGIALKMAGVVTVPVAVGMLIRKFATNFVISKSQLIERVSVFLFVVVFAAIWVEEWENIMGYIKQAGLITLVSFISPFKSERKMARDLFEDNEFIEIFVDTPLEECESRDPKGLYKKARSGILKNFTGIDSDYEVPSDPEIKLKTLSKNPEELADEVLDFLKVNNII